MVLSGDASNDIDIEMPADIAFYMILHLKVPLPEVSAT
jgi:hypothetical protein